MRYLENFKRPSAYRRLGSLALLFSLIAGLFVPASAAEGEGIPIRVTRPDARIGAFTVWAEECDESGNPTGSARYECTDTPAAGETMDYLIPVSFPTHRQDYLVHVISVPDERYQGFFSGSEKTMVWTYYYVTGLTLDPAFSYQQIGSTQTITPVFEPEGASATLSWQSSDESIATVDENGTVTALSEGTAIITAAVANTDVTANCEIMVTYYEPPTVNATCGHANGFHGGNGSATDPYRIYSTSDFLHIASHASNTNFRQIVDIDFGGATITPLTLTSGSYDGGYHTLKNLKVSGTYGGCTGVFYDVKNCTVQRTGIENATVANTNSYGHTGMLIGYLQGNSTVRECYALNCTTNAGNVCGGLIGYTESGTTIIQCCYALGGTVSGNGSYGVGAVVGLVRSYTTMTDCYAIPYSNNSSASYRGAILGRCDGGSITFTGRHYFYPISGMTNGYGGNKTAAGANLLTSLNPMSKFSDQSNFAFSSGDWIWREVSFKGSGSGLSVPTIKGFAHAG